MLRIACILLGAFWVAATAYPATVVVSNLGEVGVSGLNAVSDSSGNPLPAGSLCKVGGFGSLSDNEILDLACAQGIAGLMDSFIQFGPDFFLGDGADGEAGLFEAALNGSLAPSVASPLNNSAPYLIVFDSSSMETAVEYLLVKFEGSLFPEDPEIGVPQYLANNLEGSFPLVGGFGKFTYGSSIGLTDRPVYYTASAPSSTEIREVVAHSVAGGSIRHSGALSKVVAGTELTVTAEPQSGYFFYRWQNGIAGTTNPASVMINDDVEFEAVFLSNSFEVVDRLPPVLEETAGDEFLVFYYNRFTDGEAPNRTVEFSADLVNWENLVAEETTVSTSVGYETRKILIPLDDTSGYFIRTRTE